MNARHIQQAIYNKHGRMSALMVPNFTPVNWWECDVLRLTKTGYAEEFEVKVSLSDFKADAKKSDACRFNPDRPVKTKHERLEMKDCFPSRFWFAVPSELAKEVRPLLPPWAGLVYCYESNGYHGLRIDVPAPRLHKNKMDERIIEVARGVFYWRFWNLRGETLRKQPLLPFDLKPEALKP